MTLDMAMCEWCDNSTPAMGTLRYHDQYFGVVTVTLELCMQHGSEAASDITEAEYTPYPYTAWEDAPDYADGIPVRHVEALEKLGIPYPVSGDATTIHQQTPWTMWHNPDGEMYS